MDTFLLLVFLIVAVVSFSNSSPFISRESFQLSQANVSQTQRQIDYQNTPSSQHSSYIPSPASQSETITPSPVLKEKNPQTLIDTYITEGPKEGEIIIDTNRVVFNFAGQVLSGDKEKTIYFETKIKELDEKWTTSHVKSRTFELPVGENQYTFLVRAKTSEGTDSTPAQRKFTINISPDFHKVMISSASRSYNAGSSLVTLRTHLSQGEKINITGWSLKGKGGFFIVPQGVKKYYSFPDLAPAQDIIITQSNTVYLSGGYNPLSRGTNFLSNKCMGYFTQQYSFPSPISGLCPKPQQKDISHLSLCCQQLILRSGECTPDYSKKIDLLSDYQCSSYIEQHLNYHGCLQDYSKDDNFFGKDWHIFIGRDIVVKNDCDTIILYDSQSRIVDSYSYGAPACK